MLDNKEVGELVAALKTAKNMLVKMYNAWGQEDKEMLAAINKCEKALTTQPPATGDDINSQIGFDKGSPEGDKTAVTIRCNGQIHIIPHPFASALIARFSVSPATGDDVVGRLKKLTETSEVAIGHLMVGIAKLKENDLWYKEDKLSLVILKDVNLAIDTAKAAIAAMEGK